MHNTVPSELYRFVIFCECASILVYYDKLFQEREKWKPGVLWRTNTTPVTDWQGSEESEQHWTKKNALNYVYLY